MQSYPWKRLFWGFPRGRNRRIPPLQSLNDSVRSLHFLQPASTSLRGNASSNVNQPRLFLRTRRLVGGSPLRGPSRCRCACGGCLPPSHQRRPLSEGDPPSSAGSSPAGGGVSGGGVRISRGAARGEVWWSSEPDNLCTDIVLFLCFQRYYRGGVHEYCSLLFETLLQKKMRKSYKGGWILSIYSLTLFFMRFWGDFPW